jgi:hypothetical protein
MSLDELKSHLIGVWAGENILRLSWMPPPEYHSLSELNVTPIVREKFLAFEYNWSHENAPHEGLLLVGYDAAKQVVNATWVDSWHSSTKPLALSGTADRHGTIDLRGSYEVPNHPDWGWHIVITIPEKDTLQIVMYNVSPEGEKDLAVQVDYKRIQKEITRNERIQICS